MELCNLPLVLVIGSWMRVREVSLLVYQQIRGFIAESYRFMANEKEKDIDCGTHF